MKVIELKAERFKRLTAVEIRPSGNTVVISGRNGQGKSSVLDAIWHALCNNEATKGAGTTRPIKEGESDAVVRVNLGDIIVTRKWTESGNSTLTVESAEGKKFSSPQALLDSLVGGFSFDPLAFTRLAAKEQRTALIDLVKLNIDPDELDAKAEQAYNERTIVNRQLKAAQAELGNMAVPSDDIPTEEISVADAMKELNNARHQKSSYEDAQNRLEALRKKAADLKAELDRTITEGKELSAALSTWTCPDVDALEQEVLAADKTNERIRAKQRYLDTSARAAALEKQSATYTKELATIDKQRRDAFAGAKMPIDGLAFDAEGITFRGVPFKQCSSAEQLKACIAIAAALNPKIRVIRVADASLLDAESMELVQQMAEEHDIQMWLERVADNGEGVGVVIEDGEVVRS